MKHLFIFVAYTFCLFSCTAQSSDILALKKNGRTIKTFFPGNEISITTTSGYYNAYITSINRDTVFLIQYDVRQRPSNLGVYFLDTVAVYHYGIDYRQITALNKDHNKKFNWAGSGGALFGGGVLLTTVGLGTWIFAKPNTRYYTSPYLVGSAAFLAGVGYLLVKSGSKGLQIGKKYTLQYVRVN